MTITELIAALQQFPNPDTTDVIVNGYEGGYVDLTSNHLVAIDVVCNANSSWWYGPHDDLDSIYDDEGKIQKSCVLLSRTLNHTH